MEITSGTCAGYQTDIVSNDTTSVYTVVDLTTCIGAGATYKIYPHWTIGTLFGPQNQAGFLGGSASSADQIQVWSVGSQAYGTTYYYKTTGVVGGTGWRSTASLSASVTNVPIYIDQGLALSRKVISNGLGAGGSTVNIIGNAYPAGQPLGASGLYTGSIVTGLGGGSASTADQLQLWIPGSQAYGVTYYYKTTGVVGGTGWRSTASLSADASTNTIPLGSSVAVVRQPNRPTFNWVAPQPFTQ
jgi:hypothetical protein